MSVERVQLGVRMEKHLVKVLKGLAEFNGVTLGELLERIVLHSFEPVKGQEGEASASPHGKAALRAIADLKRIYGMDYESMPLASLKGMSTMRLRANTKRALHRPTHR